MRLWRIQIQEIQREKEYSLYLFLGWKWFRFLKFPTHVVELSPCLLKALLELLVSLVFPRKDVSCGLI